MCNDSQLLDCKYAYTYLNEIKRKKDNKYWKDNKWVRGCNGCKASDNKSNNNNNNYNNKPYKKSGGCGCGQ